MLSKKYNQAAKKLLSHRSLPVKPVANTVNTPWTDRPLFALFDKKGLSH
jgi:hypothetical protein